MFGWRKTKKSKAKEPTKNKDDKSFNSFCEFSTKCIEIAASMLKGIMFDIGNMLVSLEMYSEDALSIAAGETAQFLNMISYLAIRQFWGPYGEKEAQFLNICFGSFAKPYIDKKEDGRNWRVFAYRMEDYQQVLSKSPPCIGQSLFDLLNDEQLNHFTKEANGRCVILYTDFICFSLIRNDFVTLQDVQALSLLSISERLMCREASNTVLSIGIDALLKMQETVLSIKK